jgi:CheY-like chemotaxis protein
MTILDRILPEGGLTRLLQGLRPVEVVVPLRTRHAVEETLVRLQPLIRERQLIGCLLQLSDPVAAEESFETDMPAAPEIEEVLEATVEELVAVPALLEVQPTHPPSAAVAAVVAPPKPKDRPLQILLVESDPVAAQQMLDQLGRLHHEVALVQDGNDALSAYHERHFDAILCCEEPLGFSGVDLCKKLRQDTRGGYPYFILMTPVGARQQATKALEAGVDAFLNKPLEAVELQVRLKVARGVQSRLNRVYSTLIPAPPVNPAS